VPTRRFRGNLFARHEVRVAKTVEKNAILKWRRQPFRTNEVRVSKTGVKYGKFAILHCQRQPFRTKWGSSVKNWRFFASLVGPTATFSHETRFECQTLKVFCELGWPGSPFARNEVRVSKTDGFLRVWLVRRQTFRTKWSSRWFQYKKLM